MVSLRARVAGFLALGLMGWVAGADAEIYRWTDESGRMHFTQDLAQVPPRLRAAAEAGAKKAPARSRVQTFSPPASRKVSNALSSRAAARSAIKSADEVIEVPVQRAGNSLRVMVLINGRLNVPFLIDTGATDVVLPAWAAKDLELELEGARTAQYNTANGVITQKLVRLESVSLKGAKVKNVPAAVSETMQTGLLGLSYFNHFQYNIDPVAGKVTLRHNDLAESGILRGGRSRSQWQQSFAASRYRIREMQTRREDIPFGRTRKRERFDDEIEKLEKEYALLEAEADEAHVPFSWRD